MYFIYVHIFLPTRLISQYHPKYVKSSKEQNAAYLQSRVQGFLYLLESGSLETLSQDHSDDIIKLMDTGEVKVHSPSQVFMSLSLYLCCCSCHQDGGRHRQ